MRGSEFPSKNVNSFELCRGIYWLYQTQKLSVTVGLQIATDFRPVFPRAAPEAQQNTRGKLYDNCFVESHQKASYRSEVLVL